jgi:RNA polymerase sigma-70 factor, ECF subfamily
MVDFHELYDRYASDVRRFALFLCGDSALADDITSETFLRAWSSAAPIREATVKSYLFTIARNLYLQELRGRDRRRELPEEVAAAGADPERRASGRASLAAVLAALERLPEIDRSALLMRAQDAMPYDEIARALGISAVAVRVKVHRARLKLANWFPEEVPT